MRLGWPTWWPTFWSRWSCTIVGDCSVEWARHPRPSTVLEKRRHDVLQVLLERPPPAAEGRLLQLERGQPETSVARDRRKRGQVVEDRSRHGGIVFNERCAFRQGCSRTPGCSGAWPGRGFSRRQSSATSSICCATMWGELSRSTPARDRCAYALTPNRGQPEAKVFTSPAPMTFLYVGVERRERLDHRGAEGAREHERVHGIRLARMQQSHRVPTTSTARGGARRRLERSPRRHAQRPCRRASSRDVAAAA
jgi:hypothetical protein